MYRKIIVGHDLRDGGDDALALGRQLAEAGGAELVVAGVVPFGVLPMASSGVTRRSSPPRSRGWLMPPERSRKPLRVNRRHAGCTTWRRRPAQT
jgi:nucleotide-binding universal stress UspA family protein